MEGVRVASVFWPALPPLACALATTPSPHLHPPPQQAGHRLQGRVVPHWLQGCVLRAALQGQDLGGRRQGRGGGRRRLLNGRGGRRRRWHRSVPGLTKTGLLDLWSRGSPCDGPNRHTRLATANEIINKKLRSLSLS